MAEQATKVVGIIGGMGPYPTADLFQRILDYTEADADQGHLEILIVNDPRIPDRTNSIKAADGDAFYDKLLYNAERLTKMGADFLVIPCNTSHFWFSKLEEDVSIKALNMIEATRNAVIKGNPGVKKLGLLATDGTVKSKLYESFFDSVDLLTPSEDSQRAVMELIYGPRGIKAGFIDVENKERLRRLADELLEGGAQQVILGCTELSLFYRQLNSDRFIDPIDILARRTIEYAGLD